MPGSRAEIAVRVTPRSSKNRVESTPDGIRVWVTAAPTDGQANDAVEKAVANALGVAKSRVAILRGDKSRDKTLGVDGLTREEVFNLLSLAR